LAIDSVPEEAVTENNKHLKQLYEGLKMTDARLLQVTKVLKMEASFVNFKILFILSKVFARHGLTQINPLDTKFNPNEHEAVVQQVRCSDLFILYYYVFETRFY
jgi:molecular chaperone GrpE